MYKNEYLEECLKGNKGNYYLLRGYRYTKKENFNELIIDDLGFIHHNYFDLEEFKSELIKADIKEFILTSSNSGLISTLAGLDSVNIKIRGLKKTKHIDKWTTDTEDIKEGLSMEIVE